jgi:hypothetical protein
MAKWYHSFHTNCWIQMLWETPVNLARLRFFFFLCVLKTGIGMHSTGPFSVSWSSWEFYKLNKQHSQQPGAQQQYSQHTSGQTTLYLIVQLVAFLLIMAAVALYCTCIVTLFIFILSLPAWLSESAMLLRLLLPLMYSWGKVLSNALLGGPIPLVPKSHSLHSNPNA